MLKKLFVAAFVAIASLTSYAQTLKIGTFDYQAIQNSMPETNVVESEIAKRRTTAETELNKMQTELQNKATAYDAEADSLDDVTKQIRTEELQTLYQRIQQYQQAQGMQLQQYVQQQQALIQEKIFKAVKAVGDREKFVAIFPTDESIYFSPTETSDVTAKVKTELGIKQ